MVWVLSGMSVGHSRQPQQAGGTHFTQFLSSWLKYSRNLMCSNLDSNDLIRSQFCMSWPYRCHDMYEIVPWSYSYISSVFIQNLDYESINSLWNQSLAREYCFGNQWESNMCVSLSISKFLKKISIIFWWHVSKLRKEDCTTTKYEAQDTFLINLDGLFR